MELAISNRTRCLVCGFSEVQVDEVVDRGLLYLAECPRCESRWTSGQPLAKVTARAALPPVRGVRRVDREVAPAA